MFRSCVLSWQKRGKNLKIFAQYSSKPLSNKNEEIRQRIFANGKPHPEFSTIGKRINDLAFGFANIPPKDQYNKMYSNLIRLDRLDWILQKTFNMDRDVVLQFLSNVTKKISDKDSSVAQHLTTECFNRVTAYQQSENFQDSVNRFKMRIEPKDVLLFWYDEQMSNEKSIRLVMLTYPNVTLVRSSRFVKEFVPELMKNVERNFTKDGYKRRYDLRREKEKVKVNVKEIDKETSIYLQTNDILVWNFDFLKPDINKGILKVQNIAVVKLENCLHQEEHAIWKHYLNIFCGSIIDFSTIVSCETTSFYRKPVSHLRYFLALKFGKKVGKKVVRLAQQQRVDLRELKKMKEEMPEIGRWYLSIAGLSFLCLIMCIYILYFEIPQLQNRLESMMKESLKEMEKEMEN